MIIIIIIIVMNNIINNINTIVNNLINTNTYSIISILLMYKRTFFTLDSSLVSFSFLMHTRSGLFQGKNGILFLCYTMRSTLAAV